MRREPGQAPQGNGVGVEDERSRLAPALGALAATALERKALGYIVSEIRSGNEFHVTDRREYTDLRKSWSSGKTTL